VTTHTRSRSSTAWRAPRPSTTSMGPQFAGTALSSANSNARKTGIAKFWARTGIAKAAVRLLGVPVENNLPSLSVVFLCAHLLPQYLAMRLGASDELGACTQACVGLSEFVLGHFARTLSRCGGEKTPASICVCVCMCVCVCVCVCIRVAPTMILYEIKLSPSGFTCAV
jgi:hypothetical protein